MSKFSIMHKVGIPNVCKVDSNTDMILMQLLHESFVIF